MTEDEALDLIERLRRSNQRWKALATGAFMVIVLGAVAWYFDATEKRFRAARANEMMLVEARRARAEAEAHRAEAVARERAAATNQP